MGPSSVKQIDKRWLESVLCHHKIWKAPVDGSLRAMSFEDNEVRGPVDEGTRTYSKGRSKDKTRRVHADRNRIVSNAMQMQSGSCWNISERPSSPNPVDL